MQKQCTSIEHMGFCTITIEAKENSFHWDKCEIDFTVCNAVQHLTMLLSHEQTNMQDKWNKFWLRQQIHACVSLPFLPHLKSVCDYDIERNQCEILRTIALERCKANTIVCATDSVQWFGVSLSTKDKANIQNECMISFAASHRNNNVCFKSSVPKMKPYAFLTVRTYTNTLRFYF